MSSIIIPLLDPASFDAEIVKGMGIAYDRALRELHDRGQPEMVKEVLAKRIIEAATAGERDSERLCEIALGRTLSPG
jgi:hypothetical protein